MKNKEYSGISVKTEAKTAFNEAYAMYFIAFKNPNLTRTDFIMWLLRREEEAKKEVRE